MLFAAVLPIWWVVYFFATDVPAHLHSAKVFADLLLGHGGNGFYALNETIVPNSLGHWLMAALLLAFSPETVSKMTATLTWAVFAAAVPWLRYCVRGADGLGVSVLFGAVLATNFLWLLGLYNFILGASAALFAIGLLFRWDGGLSWGRVFVLAGLALAAFLGHLVAFAALVLAVGVHVVLGLRKYGGGGLLKVAAAFLPVLPLFAAYQLSAHREATMVPRWLIADAGFTLAGFTGHLKHTDPLSVIGGHSVAPFIEGESPLFLIASPMLWAIVAIGLLSATAVGANVREFLQRHRTCVSLMLVFLVLALAAPDELGSTHGSILRPRLMLVAAALFAPLFAVPVGSARRYLVYGALGAAFALQMGAVWEYSLRYDREARVFLAAAEAVPPGDRLASVMVMRDEPKFHESAIKRLSSVVGVAKDAVVWDNYETGYYFFPVVAASEGDRQLVRDFSALNTFRTRRSEEEIKRNELLKFDELLGLGRERFDTLIVWGRDAQVDETIAHHAEPAPYFEYGSVRLFRLRP